ncbi:MAG: hypothetical protein IJ639_05590 [Ruminococcus sp.]|nr:hypothetical protein [Ruminococcus sp.]
MVRKLIKYDFASYMRLLLPVQLILLGIAALNRIIQLFEDGSTVYRIVFASSTVLYVISIIVALVLTMVVGIVRFYQGMYTGEGYLSHTLPVTPTQHIFSKLIVSVLYYLGTFLSIILSLIVITLGEMNIEIFKSIGFLFGRFMSYTHGHMILFIIELFFLILFSIIDGMLCFYFCISIGQLAQKRKILLAFGVYFGLYIIGQILGTILIIIVSVLNYETIDAIARWISQHGIAFFHIMFCGGIVLELITSLIYFLITRFIMSKKLNLA